MIRLFEIENSVVKPTEHCYMIGWLKDIIKKYPKQEEHLNAFAYIFYMTCPTQENPYFNVNEELREDRIENDINLLFDTEDEVIQKALKKLSGLYETPTLRAYQGVKQMVDNLSVYMGTSKITAGRDGNLSALITAGKSLTGICDTLKNAGKDLEEEQKVKFRGDKNIAYDQLGS